MICEFCKKDIVFARGNFTRHVMYCKFNPNHIQRKGHKPSEETRKKVSEGMKRAHAEGRAHNIGECRWNNKPSYPEQWFMKMSLNEDIDQNYVREYPFHKFSLDFVWVDKKRVIEIDGEQHNRDIRQKERDIKKDKLLLEEGWKELRISWSDICNNTKEWIKIIKDFINEDSDCINEEVIHNYRDFKKKQKEKVIKKRLKEKEQLIKERKDFLDKIDINKFGWMTKVSKEWGVSWTQVKRWIKKYYPELNYYQRKSVDKI